MTRLAEQGVLAHTAAQVLATPPGYSSKFRADVEAAISAGRLPPCDDLDIPLIAAAGGAKAMLSLRLANPDVGPERFDDLVALILRSLGMPPDDAHDLITRPLPPPPST